MSALPDRRAAYSEQVDDATRTLYERYSTELIRYCSRRLRNREDAEDAVQTVFMYAFRGLRRGVVPEYESAWLYAIAENVCRTKIRSYARRGRLESVRDLDSLGDVVPAVEHDPSERADALPAALTSIPDSQRRALLLREIQGLSYREIASELGLSQSAVETLIFRARRSCRREIERLARPVERVMSGAWLTPRLISFVREWLLGAGGAKAATAAVTLATGTVLFVTPHAGGSAITGPARPSERGAFAIQWTPRSLRGFERRSPAESLRRSPGIGTAADMPTTKDLSPVTPASASAGVAGEAPAHDGQQTAGAGVSPTRTENPSADAAAGTTPKPSVSIPDVTATAPSAVPSLPVALPAVTVPELPGPGAVPELPDPPVAVPALP